MPSLYSWANILFLLEGLLNTLQKSSQASLYSETGHLFFKKETQTEIKQQPGVLEVHLQYLPRSEQFVPKDSYYTWVQLCCSFCKLKCIHWSFVYPQLRTGAGKFASCWGWMSVFIMLNSDVLYYMREDSFPFITFPFHFSQLILTEWLLLGLRSGKYHLDMETGWANLFCKHEFRSLRLYSAQVPQ